ncbi:protein Dok-7-like isoform X4 [Hippocampus zosterae]|uniref:protein Dok-7-like isoform X4 n=1 Tax=Hippocampus zosterae TaxID=109293 RepID=UPI00223D324E|nr:protein Dok-7-like isoform X4 [Hippocampus zosterae]
MTDSVVVEGYARLKEGKKWKTRWIVLRKPSPVADCLVLLVFKDKSDKVDGNKERASVTLEEICGLESGRWCEGASFTLAILCLTQAALLGFESKETLQAWEVRLRYSLGEVHRFSVGVLAGTKLESGPATLHVCNNLLAVVRDASPVVVGHWNLPDLRRYGPLPNGFVFEGGTRCGYWAGVFLLTSSESEQISFLFDCIVRGVSPTRVPFGLQPILPDPNTSQINSEERLNHETQELAKRLSMLSNRNSTASSMYCASPGGDDCSISGSSDTSDKSDGSVSSCLAIWTESSSNLSDNNVVCKTGAGVVKQFANYGGNASGVKDPRNLKEMGRQSSLDSGIATGSHSSYSGSFSSYTGSLDNSGREDFGSVFCLPPHLAQDLSPCSCPNVSGHEYKVPSSLRYLYDTPRSLAQECPSSAKDSLEPVPEYLKGASEGPLKTVSSHSRKTRGAASCDSVEPCTVKTIVTICSVCGGLQGMPFNPASGVAIPALPDKRPSGRGEKHRADPAYEIMESRAERTSEAEEKSKCQVISCGPQKLLQEMEGTALAYHQEALLAERSRRDSVTYVNIPVSPTSKKQLNYMELELQESGTQGTVVPATAQSKGKGSTTYAQIDITATETAHKVGTQHALGRQEGLHTLERRRKGTPH